MRIQRYTRERCGYYTFFFFLGSYCLNKRFHGSRGSNPSGGRPGNIRNGATLSAAHSPRLRLRAGIRTNFARGVMLTPAIFIGGGHLSRFNAQTCTPVQWIGNIFAWPLCAIIPQLRPISTTARRPEWILCNGRVTAHRLLIFRACHRNSISARRPTPARNSNSVSVVASINYGIGQLAGNN